jgi:hypothetical protein
LTDAIRWTSELSISVRSSRSIFPAICERNLVEDALTLPEMLAKDESIREKPVLTHANGRLFNNNNYLLG